MIIPPFKCTTAISYWERFFIVAPIIRQLSKNARHWGQIPRQNIILAINYAHTVKKPKIYIYKKRRRRKKSPRLHWQRRNYWHITESPNSCFSWLQLCLSLSSSSTQTTREPQWHHTTGLVGNVVSSIEGTRGIPFPASFEYLHIRRVHTESEQNTKHVL